VWLTNDHLVPEQLTDDQAQRGAAMSECHVKAFKIAELAKRGFSITGYRPRSDAVAGDAEGRRASEHL
jgi:hypothetical protein